MMHSDNCWTFFSVRLHCCRAYRVPSLECLGNGNPLCRNTLIQKLSDLGGNLFCELQDTRVIGAQFSENDQAVFGKFRYYVGALVQAVGAMV